jgi:uncharacterized protein YciI
MPHFIVEITYRAPLGRIDQTLAAHRAHLQGGYDRGLLLCSGPQVPRSGGFLVARAPAREVLDQFIAQDPYAVEGLADYRVVEFQPVKHQAWAAEWFAPQ